MPLTDFASRFTREYPHLVGGRVLVALSGGPDSVALLHLLLDPRLQLGLEAAHVHHGVRGQEADDDGAFCRTLCDQLHVPFRLVKIAGEQRHRDGQEASWRRLRYRALEDLSVERGIDWIATGHQRDDVAEGVLMQLLRGGGPRALAGISASRTESRCGVVRPLLPFTRAAILAWLGDRGIGWREDSSNRDLRHLRNRVRHRVLPELEATSPRLRDHLVALASTLAEDEAFLTDELETRAVWIDPWAPDGGVPLSRVGDLPGALRARWLHAQATRAGIGRVTRKQLHHFLSMVRCGQPRAVNLCGRWRLRLARATLWLEPPSVPPPFRLVLDTTGTFLLPLPGWQVRVSIRCADASSTSWSWTPPEGNITVRSPRPGDVLLEGESPRRLGPILARSLPRHLRSAWPVFCAGDTIKWVPGMWQDEATGTPGSVVVEVTRT